MSSPPTRPVLARYLDPLDVVWLSTARQLGLRVRRNQTVYAATNGAGLLELGPSDTLDPDDCTAQMIFHELCHWVTNGVASVHVVDWGCPPEPEDLWVEFACLRLQAALSAPWGLRRLLAPTTLHRAYYDRLTDDALAPLDDGEVEARVVARARQALADAMEDPWQHALQDALRATSAIQAAVQPVMAWYQSDENDGLPSLWAAHPHAG